MARRLTVAEREEKGARAYELSAQSWSERRVAEEIGVNRHTVSRLLKEERERQRERRDAAADDAIAVYEAVKRHAWERLTGENLKANSYSVSALLNNIIAAQKAEDGITGVEASKDSGGVNVNVNIDNRRQEEKKEEQFERLFAEIDRHRAAVDVADGRGDPLEPVDSPLPNS